MSTTRQKSRHYEMFCAVQWDVGMRATPTYISFEGGCIIRIPSKTGNTILPLYIPNRIIGVWGGFC